MSQAVVRSTAMTGVLAQTGAIPGFMGGSAYKGTVCYKRSAWLGTPRGPRLNTCM
jgi:hypothetical protein